MRPSGGMEGFIMKIIRSMVLAFSMFSRIPVPRVQWNEENMKYSLCFFPLIGVVIGALELLALRVCTALNTGAFFQGAVLCAVPVLVTGGIHMDGFCDTTDALSSRQSRERKLEILKDSHTGAFAVICTALYFLLYAGALSEVDSMRRAGLLAAGFVLSRSLSGLALVLFKSARKDGTLHAFSSAAHKRTVFCVLLGYILVSFGGLFYFAPLTGLLALLAGGAVFGCYGVVAYRQFGGITGDLAGWFLQCFELVFALTVVLGGRWGALL